MYFKKKKKKRSLSLAKQKKKKWIEKNKNKKKRQRCPKKRKKEKKWQHYYLGEKEKKKIKATWRSPCAHAHEYFCQSRKNSYPLNFLSTLGRKHFGGFEEKTSESHHLFLFLLTQPNTLQKGFSSHFHSKVFHPPCFISKQTHPKAATNIRGITITSRVHCHIKSARWYCNKLNYLYLLFENVLNFVNFFPQVNKMHFTIYIQFYIRWNIL